MSDKYKTIDVTEVKNGRTVMVGKYWLCRDGDPQKAIFFNSTAQCNEHKQISERLKKYTEEKTGWKIGIVFLDIAYNPSNGYLYV